MHNLFDSARLEFFLVVPENNLTYMLQYICCIKDFQKTFDDASCLLEINPWRNSVILLSKNRRNRLFRKMFLKKIIKDYLTLDF